MKSTGKQTTISTTADAMQNRALLLWGDSESRWPDSPEDQFEKLPRFRVYVMPTKLPFSVRFQLSHPLAVEAYHLRRPLPVFSFLSPPILQAAF